MMMMMMMMKRMTMIMMMMMIAIIFGEQLHLYGKHQCVLDVLDARLWFLEHASFAQSAESAILDYVISNVNISGSIHTTVLKFGEHIPVCVFYKPTKFHVNRIAHSQSSKRGCASCPCIFDPLCSVSSDRHILASGGPISLRFGQEVKSEVLLTSSESQVTRHYR